MILRNIMSLSKKLHYYLFSVEPHPFCRYKRRSRRALMNWVCQSNSLFVLNYLQFAEVHQRGEASGGCSRVNPAGPAEATVRSGGRCRNRTLALSTELKPEQLPGVHQAAGSMTTASAEVWPRSAGSLTEANCSWTVNTALIGATREIQTADIRWDELRAQTCDGTQQCLCSNNWSLLQLLWLIGAVRWCVWTLWDGWKKITYNNIHFKLYSAWISTEMDYDLYYLTCNIINSIHI